MPKTVYAPTYITDLNIESFTLINQDASFITVGSDPWLDTADNQTSYVEGTGGVAGDNMYYWDFQNLTNPILNQTSITIEQVNLTMWSRNEYGGFTYVLALDLWNGTDYEQAKTIGIAGTNWLFSNLGAVSFLDSYEKVNATRLRLRHISGTDGWISYVALRVTYSGTPPQWILFLPIRLIMGLLGIIIIILAPSLTVQQVYKKKNYRFLITFFILLAIGYGLIASWLA